MIHFTCDRCGRPIDPANEIRYTVKMEVQAAMETWEDENQDEDRDHLMEVHEILDREDEFDDDHSGLEVYRRMRFDLCTNCHQQFMPNPLGKSKSVKLGFSEN